jgi:hypothetical protein
MYSALTVLWLVMLKFIFFSSGSFKLPQWLSVMLTNPNWNCVCHSSKDSWRFDGRRPILSIVCTTLLLKLHQSQNATSSLVK